MDKTKKEILEEYVLLNWTKESGSKIEDNIREIAWRLSELDKRENKYLKLSLNGFGSNTELKVLRFWYNTKDLDFKKRFEIEFYYLCKYLGVTQDEFVREFKDWLRDRTYFIDKKENQIGMKEVTDFMWKRFPIYRRKNDEGMGRALYYDSDYISKSRTFNLIKEEIELMNKYKNDIKEYNKIQMILIYGWDKLREVKKLIKEHNWL